MNEQLSESASQNLKKIIDSARRMGVELDESEALQWLAAMGSMRKEDDVAIDVRQGVFGHRITLLDFSPERLEYFRRVGKLVEFSDVPGQVETALALSGSARNPASNPTPAMPTSSSASTSKPQPVRKPAGYWRKSCAKKPAPPRAVTRTS